MATSDGQSVAAVTPLCASGPEDLTWLLHRAAQRLRATLDGVAGAHGLAGARDWVVLGAIIADASRTQLALATQLGVDKTTMTSLLDRLEDRRLVQRVLDPCDRRVRIPVATGEGRRLHAAVTCARDEAEQELLGGFTAQEKALLRELLMRLTTGSA